MKIRSFTYLHPISQAFQEARFCLIAPCCIQCLLSSKNPTSAYIRAVSLRTFLGISLAFRK